MIRKRIAILFDALGCSNSDIARYIGISPSNISRLRTGARTYKPSSPLICNFADGVYMFADKNDMLDVLCKLCAREDAGKDEIIRSLTEWLFSSEKLPEINLPSAPKSKPDKYLKFGGKLNKIMTMLDISNIQLARKLNSDPSSISRFRNGLRSPKTPVAEALSYELISYSIRNNKIRELEKISGFAHGTLTADDSCAAALAAWLCDKDSKLDMAGIDKLLDNLDSLSSSMSQSKSVFPATPSEFITEDILNSDKTVYWGTEGLRDAVVRFLARSSQGGGELWLYSDQNMHWLTGSRIYQAKWLSLMIACIQNGVKIKIIHNVERGIGEMLSAIEMWLPLYMSGAIESYVCRRKNDGRFTHTMFINIEKECIFASHVGGTEDAGWYEYITDKKVVDAVSDEYTNLIHQSAPLIKIYFNNYINKSKSENLSLLLSSPSVATMPKNLLSSILLKNGVSKAETADINKFRDARLNEFETALKSGKVSEFIVLPTSGELRSGSVRVNLSPSLCDAELTYSTDEYAKHLRSVVELLENNDNYNLYILPEMPFTNIQIVSTDKNISVIRSEKPYAAFVFSEPLMLRSFKSYFDMLKSKFKADKDSTIKRLKSLLADI